MVRPLIIGVGGSKSNSGKTTFASDILRMLTEVTISSTKDQSGSKEDFKHSSLKTKKRWGAIKYTKTEIYSSIIEDFEILNEDGKDTKRFIDSGAEKVIWIKATIFDLPEIIPIALDRLYHLDGILIEGNSAILIANPDIIIFISLDNSCDFKPTAWKVLENAQIVIMSDNSPLINIKEMTKRSKVFILDDFQRTDLKNIINEVIDHMNKLVNRKDIERLLIEHSVDKRITCQKARALAEEFGIPYSEVGRIADELKIKIVECQLGCF
ncbi:MAG: hypothetical protein N2511_03365 [Thermodesulfovibrionales bacterium]|nr:hypothetical protein [Thermodesulfovibrionales bacterium]